MGEQGAAVFDQLALGRGRAMREHHEGLDRLAPFLVGHADHRDLGHRRVRAKRVLDLDRRDILAAGDDHILLAIGDGDVAVAVHRAAVASVEPTVLDRGFGCLGRLPVAIEHDIAARDDFSAGLNANLHADGWSTRATELLRTLVGGKRVPLSARAVEGEERRCLGEPVELDELPAEFGFDALDGARWRRGAGDHHAHAVAARDRTVPVKRGVEHRTHHRGRATHHVHAVLGHTAQDLRAADLAQHDLPRAHARKNERHSPAVAVECRQRVQVNIAVARAEMEAEGDGVDPQIAVRELHALGPRGGAAGVVDGGGGVLVAGPCFWRCVGHLRCARREQQRVGFGAEDRPSLAGNVGKRVDQLRVDQQQPRARMLDDVADLRGAQPEIHRHEHASRRGHAVERDEQARRVLRNNRDALAEADAERVEVGRAVARERGDSAVVKRAHAWRGLRRLVDDADAVAAHQAESDQSGRS